jgi:hypothetical protein
MRFSLRTLLLFFPTLIVSYGIALTIVMGFIDKPRFPYPAGWDRYEYNHLCHYMLKSNRENVTPLVWRKLNSYFVGSLSPSDPDYVRFSTDYPNQADERGYPYGCLPLNESFEPDENQVTPKWFGFYSVGADGISRTQGNDPDDINTWHYEQPAARLAWEEQKSWHYRKPAIWLTPVTLLVVCWAWKKLTRPPHEKRGVADDAV